MPFFNSNRAWKFGIVDALDDSYIPRALIFIAKPINLRGIELITCLIWPKTLRGGNLGRPLFICVEFIGNLFESLPV